MHNDGDEPVSHRPDARCRECGTRLGAGYLCDSPECDTVEGWDDV